MFRWSSAVWPIAAVILVCSAPAARAEETILFFERLQRTTSLRPASQGGNVVTDTSRAEIAVALGSHRLVVYETQQVWIYDFAGRRVKNVSRRNGTVSDWSLHAFVAFKERELKSRLALRDQMMASRPGPGPSVLDLESLFSIPALAVKPGRGESLVDSSAPGRVRVLINHQVAMEAALSDTVLSADRAAMFDRFLAFHAHVHPSARHALARTGRLPRQIYHRYRDFNDETQVLLRLTRVSTAPEDNDPAATSRPVEVDDPAYQELDARLRATRGCAQWGDWLEASRRFEAAALDSGRYLDAALAQAERVLGACEAPAPWPAKIEARVRGDTAIAACRAGLAWRDTAGARAALDQLDRVDGRELKKGNVLDLLRARARLAIGDLDTGAYLMMGALGGNPCMAGSWLDLADGYLEGYQTVLAWSCMEAADRAGGGACDSRRAHRAELERALERRYPDLFE